MKQKTPEEIAWIAVGILDVMVRTDEATNTMATDALRDVLNREPMPLSLGLQAVAAMSIASASGDNLYLEKTAKLNLKDEDVSLVKYDLLRILKYSDRTRAFFKILRAQWSGFTDKDMDKSESVIKYLTR